MKEKRGQR